MLLAAGACTIRLGGPAPVEYRALGWEVPAGVPSADAAAFLLSQRAGITLLAAPADSAWFSELASAAGQALSGPAPAGPVRLAFLGAEPLGDTTIALPVEGGGELIVHDALYEVDEYRFLDLMAVRLEPDANVRESVRSLLRYIATDVMADAAVVLAVNVPNAAMGDSVATLLRPVLTDALRCGRDAGSSDAADDGPKVRLFVGPEARALCEGAERLEQPNSPVLVRMVVPR